MDKKMLQDTFREWKKVSGADFAITNPDGLGDCASCVGGALCDKYGEDAKGMFVKHWTRGMNGNYPIGDDRIKFVYLAHDIDEDMAKTVYEVFGRNYNILPAEYNPSRCFALYEKDTPVWVVSYTNEYDRACSEEFLNSDDAFKRLNSLFTAGRAKSPTLARVF